MKTCGCPPAVPCPIIWDNLAPIALVHLCCSLKLTEVLPAALYKCASEQPVSALFAALVANDNSLYSLTTDELKECMETRDYLAEQTRIMYQSLLNGETATGCADVLRCGAKMKDMVIEYHKTSHMVDFGALRALKSWVTSSTLAYGGIFGIPKNSSNALCAICASHVLAAIEKRQKEVWQNLRAKFCAPTVSQTHTSDKLTGLWDRSWLWVSIAPILLGSSRKPFKWPSKGPGLIFRDSLCDCVLIVPSCDSMALCSGTPDLARTLVLIVSPTESLSLLILIAYLMHNL